MIFHQAGDLRIQTGGDRLDIRAPRPAEPIARAFIDHEVELLAAPAHELGHRAAAFRNQVDVSARTERHAVPLRVLPDAAVGAGLQIESAESPETRRRRCLLCELAFRCVLGIPESQA